MSMTCSKHAENYKQVNTLKIICASSWTITKNHCMMRGQKKKKTLNFTMDKVRVKTSEFHTSYMRGKLSKWKPPKIVSNVRLSKHAGEKEGI